MKKKNYFYAAIFPLIIILLSIPNLMNEQGLAQTAGQVILYLIAIPSLAIALISTYLIQKRKKMKWYHFLIIGAASTIILYLILIIYVRTTI